jgi:hypothetical protein
MRVPDIIRPRAGQEGMLKSADESRERGPVSVPAGVRRGREEADRPLSAANRPDPDAAVIATAAVGAVASVSRSRR